MNQTHRDEKLKDARAALATLKQKKEELNRRIESIKEHIHKLETHVESELTPLDEVVAPV